VKAEWISRPLNTDRRNGSLADLQGPYCELNPEPPVFGVVPETTGHNGTHEKTGEKPLNNSVVKTKSITLNHHDWTAEVLAN